MRDLDKMSRKALNAVMGIMVFLMPLVFHPFINDPFALPKSTILRICVLMLIFIISARIVKYNKIEWKPCGLNALVYVFIFIVAVSNLFSVYPSLSFWGGHGFYFEGTVSFFIYALLYFITANYLENKEMVIKLLVLSGIIVSVYAVAQSLGITLFVWRGVQPFPRVWSTMGNPNFLGSLLIMIIPACVFMLLSSGKISAKIFYSVALLLNILSLVFTYSRAAWIGMICGFIVFAVLADKKRLKVNGMYLFAVAVLSVLLVSVWPYPDTNGTTAKPVIERAASAADLSEPNIASRISGWKTALSLIKQRPFTGYGPDTFGSVFRIYMSADYEKLAGRSKTAGYAHNVLLQYASTLGLAGAGMYLAVFITFIVYLIRIAKSQEHNLLASGMAAAVAALFINNQFSFSGIVPETIFWIFMGICMGCLSGEKKAIAVKLPHFAGVSVLAVVALITVILISGCMGELFASRYDRLSQDANEDGKLMSAITLEEKAVKLNGHQDLYRMHLARLYQQSIPEEPDYEKAMGYYGKSEAEYRRQVWRFRYNTLAYNGLGVTYMYANKYLNEAVLGQALYNFEKAIEHDRYFTEAYSNLAACYYEMGKDEEAVEIYKRLINIKPEIAVNYYNLGILYVFKKDYDNAIKYFKQAIRLQPGFKECEDAMVKVWQILDGGTR